MKKIERMPVPGVGAVLGLMTLGNLYGGLGFSWFRVLAMAAGTVHILLYTGKLVLFPKTVLLEYQNPLPAALYGTYSMCLMVLGGFYAELSPAAGKWIFLIGLCLHAVHTVAFTVRHVIGGVLKYRETQDVTPAWFVTYNGIMVACVNGMSFHLEPLLRVVAVYGVVAFCILGPWILVRLLRQPLPEGAFHTLGILPAPGSLCVISLLNLWTRPSPFLLTVFYLCVLGSVLYLILRLPKFFAFPFYPGYAGLTFPMAIGAAASRRMSVYLDEALHSPLSGACLQLTGIQIFLSSLLIGYVLLRLVSNSQKT